MVVSGEGMSGWLAMGLMATLLMACDGERRAPATATRTHVHDVHGYDVGEHTYGHQCLPR